MQPIEGTIGNLQYKVTVENDGKVSVQAQLDIIPVLQAYTKKTSTPMDDIALSMLLKILKGL